MILQSWGLTSSANWSTVLFPLVVLAFLNIRTYGTPPSYTLQINRFVLLRSPGSRVLHLLLATVVPRLIPVSGPLPRLECTGVGGPPLARLRRSPKASTVTSTVLWEVLPRLLEETMRYGDDLKPAPLSTPLKRPKHPGHPPSRPLLLPATRNLSQGLLPSPETCPLTAPLDRRRNSPRITAPLVISTCLKKSTQLRRRLSCLLPIPRLPTSLEQKSWLKKVTSFPLGKLCVKCYKKGCLVKLLKVLLKVSILKQCGLNLSARLPNTRFPFEDL